MSCCLQPRALARAARAYAGNPGRRVRPAAWAARLPKQGRRADGPASDRHAGTVIWAAEGGSGSVVQCLVAAPRWVAPRAAYAIVAEPSAAPPASDALFVVYMCTSAIKGI
eukprot:COSAG01_NODE_378_length_17882_cov_62.690344_4_plen_111_part_00